MADDIVSFEDAMGRPAAAPSPPTSDELPITPFAKPEQAFSFEEAMRNAGQPKEEPGILTRTDDKSLGGKWGDIARYVATGAIKGLSHIPGFAGDIQDLGKLAGDYGVSVYQDRPLRDVAQESTKERAKSTVPSLPSGEDISHYIFNQPGVGEYKPTSPAGRAGMAGIEGALSYVSPGKVSKMVKAAIPMGLGSAAGQVVGEQTGNVPLAVLASMAGGLSGTILPRMLEANVKPEGLAKGLAAASAREYASNPDRSIAAIDRARPVQGVSPTAVDATRDPGLAQLDQQLERNSSLHPENSTVLGDLEAQRQANIARMKTIAENAGVKSQADVAAAYGLTGAAPKEMASTEARNIFAQMEEAADNGVKAAWGVPELQNASVYKNKSIGQIDDFIGKLSPTRQRAIPKDIMDDIEALRASGTRDVPLQHLQDLRSRVLAFGRENYKKGNNFDGQVNNEFGAKLADIINDDKNIVFGDKTGVARKAWNDAVDATRQYHGTFNSGFLQSLNKDISPNVPKVALDATLQSALSGKNARQNLDMLQRATSGNINPHVADYLVGDLTNNGTKIVTPADVDRYIGKNAAVIQKVPGAQQRLNTIRNASAQDQFSAAIMKNAGDPEALIATIDNNRPIRNLVARNDPNAGTWLKMMEDSARRLRTTTPDKAASSETLQKLANGRTADLLYGVGTGRIAESALGYGVTKAGEALIGHEIPGSMEMLAGAALGPKIPGVHKTVENILTGSVREKALAILQQARGNPALMKELLDTPSPDRLNKLFGMTGTGAMGIKGALTGAQEGINTNQRMGRKSGGRVQSVNHRARAADLIRKAERAKKMHGKVTEPLLNMDDSHIAAALEASNKHI